MSENINTNKDIITQVCVYNDRAMVTKQVELQHNKGEADYFFSKLPLKMVKDSVRIKGYGNLVLLDNNVNEISLEETSIKIYNDLNDRLKELKYDKMQIDHKKEMLSNLKTALNNAMNFNEQIKLPDDMNYDKAEIVDFQIALDTFNAEIEKIDSQLIDSSRNENEIKQKIQKVEKEMKLISPSASNRVYECRVNYIKKTDESVILQMMYIIEDAFWSPLYDARLLYKEREFELTLYANVSQSTGEDWLDVELSLSTADPVVGAYLPEPEIWYLDIFIPPPPPKPISRKRNMKKKKESMPMDESFDMEGGAIPPMEEEAEREEAKTEMPAEMQIQPGIESFARTTIKSSGVNVTFTGKSMQDIPSDGSDKKVFISSDNFPVKYEYVIMPAIEQAAYLKIKVKNELDYPVIKGPVKVFRDFDFVGDSKVETVAPGQEFELYMGVDDNFKVERKLINKYRENKGFSGKDTKITYTYKLIIESYKDESEQIQVFEKIPVSKNKEITVDFEEKGGFEPDEEFEYNGKVKLEFEIKPKQKKEITYSYSVRYPSERTISGLI